MSRHLSSEIRVPIDPGNPSIMRHEELCIKCGQCRDVCRDYISVLNYYDLAHTGDNAICINCGQCANVCPTGSITERDEYPEVRKAIEDPEKIVIFSTSPSVRIALGEEFGMPDGSFVQGKMVALLRRLGADYVLDTNFAADMTIVEEASELVERITEQSGPLPQFTSCCPAWVKFAEIYYPELLPNISTAKSPIGMQGPTIKTYFARRMHLDPKRIVNVAVTPCTAKKFEIRRDEMNAAGRFGHDPEIRDMDYVVTTRELAAWAREEKIDFPALEDSEYDQLMGFGSGAGVIFGNTGGVMEAALRTAYEYITGEPAPEKLYDLQPVRGMEEIREASLTIRDLTLNVAVIYGTSNVRKFLAAAKESGKQYHFVEVMTCPGGCIGGGGQPKGVQEKGRALLKERIKGLYRRDAAMEERTSHNNPEIRELYEKFYGRPLSDLAEAMLHTVYTDRSSTLGEDAGKFKTLQEFGKKTADTGAAEGAGIVGATVSFGHPYGQAGSGTGQAGSDYEEVTTGPGDPVRKWKCRVCGCIYEGENPPAECPVCHKDSSYFDLIRKWKCRVCGYVCEDVTPPAECPVCHKDSSFFDEIG